MPGIKDRVAVVGVGCTQFGEIWGKDQEDLMVGAAFRNAGSAVAAGVYDVVVACGVEKLLDQGGGGIPIDPIHPVLGHASAPAMFALAASPAFPEWGWTKEDLANAAVKNHKNGASHPKAHFRRPITVAAARNAPMISWPWGRFDCCAGSGGPAAG